jgi:signal transduction histidine kinase/CheY-like chemotaxis protein
MLPAFLAAGWVIGQTYQNEKELLEDSLRSTTRALSWVVGRDLARRADLARVLAESQTLDAGADLSAESLARFAVQARRAQGLGASWVELRSPAGLLLSTRNTAGDAIAATPRPVGEAPQMVDEPTVYPLYDTGDGAGFRAAVVHPVQRGGKTVLNIVVSVLPAELQALIDRQTLPAYAIAAIVDHQGVLVARYPGGARFVGTSATPDMRARFRQQNQGRFESVSLDGVASVGYYANAPQGWTYLTALPRERYMSAVPSALVPLLLAAVVLLALALGGALWVARSISGPVCSLRQLAARMRAGELTEDQPSGITEIDQVASALHHTAIELHSARVHLERQVEDAVARTRIAEQRISQGLRTEALGRLTGGVAHDFNNTLGIISNSAHLIERLDTTGAMQAPLAATMRAVDVGSHLTQNLMRFAGRQRVRVQPLALCAYLGDAQELIKIVLGSRVQLSVHCAPGVPHITVDPSELELALINLSLNARDAMPKGGQVRIQVRLADAAESADLPLGPYVRLAMSDNGIGMDPDTLSRIFEPFFTTKPVGKGSGLGLSQVLGFCQQAGGSAAMLSRLGEGATVSMLLPATQQPAAVDLPPPAQVELGESRPIAGLRLLLVEDVVDLAETTEQLLKAYGFVVVRALSAEQALQCADRGDAFDVVLSDVVMPGEMDGLVMARRLRQRHPQLPIVLISGYSTALVEAFDFTVLNKPCAPGEVLAALKQAIDQADVAHG